MGESSIANLAEALSRELAKKLVSAKDSIEMAVAKCTSQGI